MTDLATRSEEIAACRLCAERFAATATAHAPRPVPWLSERAPVLVSGQAPGMQVHRKGRPFDDPSGVRLRAWMGIGEDAFYDRDKVAVLPMAFCFPGYDAKGADLPPPPVCAKTWHKGVMALMPRVRLILAVGGHAQKFHLRTRGVTETVRDWRRHGPAVIPLPHPSWRNTGWLGKNPWFADELLPVLRARVAELIG